MDSYKRPSQFNQTVLVVLLFNLYSILKLTNIYTNKNIYLRLITERSRSPETLRKLHVLDLDCHSFSVNRTKIRVLE